MTPESVCAEIREALGNPESGALATALPTITAAVHRAMSPKHVKETRVVKPAESRKQNNESEEESI